MAESSRNAQLLDSLITRMDGLVSSINDREKIVSATKSQIDQFQQRTESLLDEKVGALEEKLNKRLSEQLDSTVEYTKDLYARFERMIWIGMVLLAGVSAFIGYQTFSSIPEKINSEIARIATVHAREIETIFDGQEYRSILYKCRNNQQIKN